MVDPAPLLDAVDRLADRYRALSQSRLLGNAGAAGTRAEAGLALARALAEAAQRLEEPQRAPREIPDAGAFAVGDQIAVAGHDLAAALADADPGVAEKVLEDALREIAGTAALV